MYNLCTTVKSLFHLRYQVEKLKYTSLGPLLLTTHPIFYIYHSRSWTFKVYQEKQPVLQSI